MKNSPSRSCVGLLLAAGRGRRFDATGVRDKLHQRLPDGRTVGAAAAANLRAGVHRVVAVVRADNRILASEFAALGCETIVCENADDGMAASLVTALAHTADAGGWVIALADMPHVRPATVDALVAAISAGADIAVPTHRGQRGNPVAFGPVHLPQLLRLEGDCGARKLLQDFPVTEIAVDDPGVHQDIDAPADLHRHLP